MSSQFILRLVILTVVVIAIIFFLIDYRRTHRCPQCKSGKIKEMDRLTEEIKLNKREIPGIGSKLNVSATVSMRCHACGHTWQKREIT
ncbi:hypothetical protein MNBD_CHLOROFLEXI01-339 [hydrothermal vent metagenome]|uniref:Uncharacterized protein n=1 Tax=hydrothermal vent metagenome TaxID=652676 RepID=A0A3B0V831_9ZZZZ